MVEITEDQIKRANKTSRSRGNVGKNAIVPRYVREMISKSESILDFGAGKDALHTIDLLKEGFDITAYEFGDNVREVHDPDALDKEYDVVMASNVLNVQQSRGMFIVTIGRIVSCVDDNGILLANYPASPRHLDLDADEIEEILLTLFEEVLIVGGTKKAPLFAASMPKV